MWVIIKQIICFCWLRPSGCQVVAGWFHLLNEDFGRSKHLRVTSKHNTLKWNLEIRKTQRSCGESVTEELESVCSSLTNSSTDMTLMICQVITKCQIPVSFNLTLTLLLVWGECVGGGGSTSRGPFSGYHGNKNVHTKHVPPQSTSDHPSLLPPPPLA